MENGEECSHQSCAEFEEIVHAARKGTESVPCQDAEDVVGEELEIKESSPPETVPSPRQE